MSVPLAIFSLPVQIRDELGHLHSLVLPEGVQVMSILIEYDLRLVRCVRSQLPN